MRADLLKLLVDPVSREALTLRDDVREKGEIVSGQLVHAKSGRSYPIIDGVPRFVARDEGSISNSVDSFGDQWNYFNFDKYRENWRKDIIEQTFGGLDFLKGKVILEAGAGSGMHTRWMAEAGAKMVIALELSHSVDGVMKRNLAGLDNVQVIQCSIDNIPLKDKAIEDLVVCVNVIQHTPSVEKTAKELWRVTGKGGEFCFNCYTRTDDTLLDKVRYWFYRAVRGVVCRLPFTARLWHARMVSGLGLLPGMGTLLQKADMLRRGTVAAGPGFSRRLFHSGVLNTFDYYGAHAYQHHLTLEELKKLGEGMDGVKVLNAGTFLRRPQPAGLLFRLEKRG